MEESKLEKEIKQLGIKIVTKDIEGNSEIYLIRHAMSHFNYRALVLRNKGEDWHIIKDDPSLIDPNLHSLGVMQCEANS